MSQSSSNRRLKSGREFRRIDRIAELLNKGKGPQVRLGIGDDAAVIRGSKDQLVWTTDSCIEKVHFRRDLMSCRDVGWRSFNAAVSDVAAMGASVVAALSALELPLRFRDKELFELVEGQAAASRLLRCPVAGGNLTSASQLAITTSVLGRAKAPLLRSQAREGDEVWLVGKVGLASAGLACLLRKGAALRGGSVERCVEAYRRPVALLAEGKALIGRARSAIDISDGLAGDAGHVARSSRVAIEFDEQALGAELSPELVDVAKRLRRSAMEFALYGGDDYALLATGPGSKRPKVAKVVGVVTSGSGVWIRTLFARRRRLGVGYEHFR